MKKLSVQLVLVVGAMCISTAGYSQFFKKLQKKISDKTYDTVDRKIDEVFDGKSGQHGSILGVGGAYDFLAGDSVLYSSHFEHCATGDMPRDWKTSSSGSIVKAEGVSGKWLQLQSKATYKLAHQINYPDKFTMEFDVVVAGDKVGDLSPLYFGFCKDNAVRSWNSTSDIWSLELQYYNNNALVIHSEVKDIYQPISFDLTPYANQVMHVAMLVEYNHVKIYLDEEKIVDADLLTDQKAQNFYISAPLTAEHGAKVLLGNVNINTDKVLVDTASVN